MDRFITFGIGLITILLASLSTIRALDIKELIAYVPLAFIKLFNLKTGKGIDGELNCQTPGTPKTFGTKQYRERVFVAEVITNPLGYPSVIIRRQGSGMVISHKIIASVPT